MHISNACNRGKTDSDIMCKTLQQPIKTQSHKLLKIQIAFHEIVFFWFLKVFCLKRMASDSFAFWHCQRTRIENTKRKEY